MSTEISVIDKDVFNALQNSLYPGARKEAVELVLSYCRAAKLDPMLKPVHIVPMSIEDKSTGKWSKRDIIMPGIGLYRIQAARSGEYLGCSSPVFGPDITQVLGGVRVTFPEWCEITVKRLIDEHIAEFTVREFWLENYATVSKDIAKPNTMWFKRPRGQLAKCTRAQALREGFPEMVSSHCTAEEMEGKNIEDMYESESGQIIEHSTPEVHVVDDMKDRLKAKKVPITVETLEKLSVYFASYENVSEQVNTWLQERKLTKIHELSEIQGLAMINKLEQLFPSLSDVWQTYSISKAEETEQMKQGVHDD